MEYYKRAALIAGLGGWSDTMDLFIWIYCMPVLGKEFGWGAATLGLITGLRRLGTFIHAGISGPLVDYFGRKWTYSIGNLLTGLLYVAYIFARNAWEFIIIGIFQLWTVWLTGLAGIFVFEEAPAEKRNWIYGLSRIFSIIGSLNVTLGISITGILGVGWRPLFLYNAVYNIFVAAISAIFLRESSVWLERKKLIEEGKIEQKKRIPISVLWSPKVRKMFLLACWVNFFLALSRVPDWFQTTYIMYALKIDAVTMGNLMTIATLVGALGYLIFGRLSDRRGRLFSMGITAVIGTICTIFWLTTDKFVGTGTSLSVLLYFMPFFIIWKIVFTGFLVVEPTWMSEIFPTSIRATAQSFSYVFYGIEAVISIAAGILAETIGMGLAYLLLGLGWLLLIIPPILLKAETKGVKFTAEE